MPQPYIPQTGALVPRKAQQLGAGVNGLWRNPRARAAVDFRETDGGDVREEIVVGNACGEKFLSHTANSHWLSILHMESSESIL